jgi:putative tricarboxylic transport membrane protein
LDSFSLLLHGFGTAFTLQNLFLVIVGVTVGTLVGVLPGLGPSATLALLLPITIGFPPEGTLIMMAGLYYGAKYGGSTTAILLNIPGESASVMTTLDGYALAKQGRAGAALGIAAISSFIAGTVGVIGLTLFAPMVAKLAISFGPPEFFGLMMFGLTTIILLAGESVLKGLLAAGLGLLLSTIGSDIVSGQARFTFGQIELLDGIDFIIVAVALFAVTEVLANVGQTTQSEVFSSPKRFREMLPTREDIKQSRFAFVQSSVVGFFIGCLPGAGSTIASFLSYGIQKKFSPNKEIFGKGAIDGVAAPEGANNSETGGAMVPLLTLGIPGSASTAIMLAALILYGFQPGPQLFSEQSNLVWALIASMFIGNVICVILNLPLVPVFASILKLPYVYLYPLILVISLIGIYGLSLSQYDLIIFLFFIILGYLLRLGDVPIAPLVLAFVLGPLAERSLSQSLVISNGNPLIMIERPIAAVLLTLAAILFVVSAVGRGDMVRKKVLEEEM